MGLKIVLVLCVLKGESQVNFMILKTEQSPQNLQAMIFNFTPDK